MFWLTATEPTGRHTEMRKICLLTLLLIWIAPTAFAQDGSHSQNVTSTPVQLIPQLSRQVTWLRIWNVTATGGAVLWCSRYTTSPAANQANSYPIQPGQLEEFRSSQFAPQQIPPNAVWCVATGGTAAITVDLY